MRSLISVIYTGIKFLFLKIYYGSSFKYGLIQRFSPNTEVAIGKKAIMRFGNKVRAHTGTRIRARENSKVIIGNDVSFNYNCLVTAHESIIIGDGCDIGPGVLFYDHDLEFKKCSVKMVKYNTSPIVLGKNVWIGSNAIILRGVTIGDDSVVAAGTVVRTGNYPSKSMIYNKKTMEVKTYNKTI